MLALSCVCRSLPPMRPSAEKAQAFRGRGSRHLHADDAARTSHQGQPHQPRRRRDHLGQGGLHLLGTELRQRRLSRLRLRPRRCRPSATSSARPASTTRSPSTPGSPLREPRLGHRRLVRHLDAADQRHRRHRPVRGQRATRRPWRFNSSTIYEVVIPSTSYSSSGSSTSCGGPSLAYCAYHGYLQRHLRHVKYSIEPYPSCSGCKVSGWSDVQNQEHFVCHETREAVTDPVNGWWDARPATRPTTSAPGRPRRSSAPAATATSTSGRTRTTAASRSSKTRSSDRADRTPAGDRRGFFACWPENRLAFDRIPHYYFSTLIISTPKPGVGELDSL